MEYKADGQRQHWSTTTTTSPAPPSAAPTTTTTTTTSATASLALIGAHSKCRQLSVFLAESRRLVIPQPQQQRILLQGLLSVHPSLLLFASPDSHSPTVAQDRPSTASFLHLGVYVEVVCIAVDHRFGHGAARAGPLNSVDRLLFHETIHLTNHFQQQQQQERDRDPNSAAHSSSLDHLRFPFVFDLSRISSLPPSANSDAGLSMETLTSSNTSDTHSALGLKNTGITWELHGFVAERRDVDDLGLQPVFALDANGAIVQQPSVTYRRIKAVAMPFTVAYQYQHAPRVQLPPPPPATTPLTIHSNQQQPTLTLPTSPSVSSPSTNTELRTSLLNKSNNILMTTTFLVNNTPYSYPLIPLPNTANSRGGKCSCAISLRLENLMPLHKITKVRITAKQLITLTLPDLSTHKYKNILFTLLHQPPPRYEPEKCGKFEMVIPLDVYRETRQHIIASLTGTNLSSQSSISTSIHRIFSRLATSVSSSLPGVGSSGGGMRRASEPCASSTTSNLFTQPSTTTISSFSSTAAILHNLRKHKLPAVEENLSTLLQQHHSTDSSSASTDFVSSLLDLIPKRIHPISSTPDPGSHSSPTSAATNSSSSSVELQDSPLDPHHAGPVSVCYYLSIHLFISDPHTIPGIPLERSIVAKIPFNLSCSNSADVEIEDDDDHHRRQHTGNHHHIHNQHASRRSSSSGAAASTTAASPPPPFQQIFSASSVAHMNTSTSLQGTPSSSLPIDIIMETSQQYEHRTRHGFSDPGVEIRRNQSRAMFRTPDSVTRIMAEIIDDVSSCLTTLSFISQEWVSLWTVRASAAAASHSTMVTSAADHAIVIRDILAALHTQTMDAFGDLHCEDGRVTWPRNPIPFNHIMLEAELLVRTGPNMDVTNASSPTYITTATQVKSAPETFLSLLISYSRTTRQLVLSWASSRGKGQSVDDERAFMDARKELQDAYESFDLFLSMIQDRFSSGGGEGDGDDHRPPPPF